MYMLQVISNAHNLDFGRKTPQLIYVKFLTVTIIMYVYIKRKYIKEMSYEKHFRYPWFGDSNLNRSKTDLLLFLSRRVTTKPKQWKKTSQSIILHEIAIISHTTIMTIIEKMFNYNTTLTQKKKRGSYQFVTMLWVQIMTPKCSRKAKRFSIISQQEDKTFKCCRAIYYCAEDKVLKSSTSKSSVEQDFQKAALPSSATHTKSSSSSARHYEHM